MPTCIRGRGHFCCLVLLATLAQTTSAARWHLSFGREYGQYVSGLVGSQVELFSFNATGEPSQAFFTNKYNNGSGIFGQADQYGNRRIVFDSSNDEYDFHVYDPTPSTTSDSSPDLWWENKQLPHPGQYRYEFQWVWDGAVPDGYALKTFPYNPVFQYDLVHGFNTPTKQAPGFATDQFNLTNWATTQSQSFIVPDGINRLIAAKAFCVRDLQHPKFTMIATFHEDTPDGPQVGPAKSSREVFSNEFINVVITWGVNDVPVVPGKRYVLKLSSTDGKGFNVYGTDQDNYPNGTLYNGDAAVPGSDMVGTVIGASVTPTD